MSVTRIPQLASGDLREHLADVSLRCALDDPQYSTRTRIKDVLGSLSDITARDAEAAVYPKVVGDYLTLYHTGVYGPLSPVYRRTARRPVRSRPKATRLVKDRAGGANRIVLNERGFRHLHLTPGQYRQIRLARLKSGDSDVRAKAYERFQLLRQWEGEVTELEPSHFQAAVVTTDLTGRLRRSNMRFPLTLVRNQDHDALVEGAPFYYCVGRFVNKGEVTPGSLLWFRRFLEDKEPVESLVRRAEASSKIEWTS